MALNAIGGFAGGLAQGINSGMQIHNQVRRMDLEEKHLGQLAKRDERDAEVHEMRKDQYASEKEVRERRNTALRQIAEYHTNAFAQNNQPAPGTANMQSPAAPSFGAPPEQQTPSNIKLAGPIPQGGLAMNQPAPFAADNPAGALAPAQAAQQPQEQTPPAKVLERGMVTGMYTPKMLTDISNIFAQNGLHEEGIKYMNQAYEAEKRGGVRAAMAFMQNNPGSAADALRGGGIEVEGLPVKVKPDDPNDMNWKINVKGQGEQTINVRDWLRATMDPEEFFKAEDRRAKDERDAKMEDRRQTNIERKTDAEIGFLKDRSQLARARAENPGSLKPARSSDKSIEQAITRRDKRFDLKATINEDGMDRIDPELRGAYDDTAAQLQSFIEEETGEELDHRQHHKLTDEILRFPVTGTPQEKAKATAALLRRFKLDMPEPKQEAAPTLGKTGAGRSAPAGALRPKKEPTREEQELKSLESNRNYPTLISDLKKLQKERYASNLNAKEKAEVETKIKAILDSDRSTGSLKSTSNFGKRQDGTEKGNGFLGVHKSTKGNDMTEYTVGLNINGKEMDVPTFVPGLTKEELAHLKTEPDFSKRTAINESIMKKAADHARKRLREGKSLFADK